jgi:hypothetical protein
MCLVFLSLQFLSKPVLAVVVEAGLDIELKLIPSCLHPLHVLLGVW